MLKKISLLLLLIICFSFSIVAYASETFESFNVGSFPDGWMKKLTHESSYAQIVEEDGNKFFKFYAAGDSDEINIYFDALKDRVTVELDARWDCYDDAKSEMRLGVRTYTETSAVYNFIRDDNFIQEYFAMHQPNLTLKKEMIHNKWYRLKYDIDVPAMVYNLYIDGEMIVEGASFRNLTSKDVSVLQFSSKLVDGKPCGISIDNLTICPIESKMSIKVGSAIALVNDRTVNMGDGTSGTPFTYNDRCMVPLRFIGENFGATVSYIQSSNSVGIYYRGKIINHKIGSNEFYINGELLTADVESLVTDGRTFVPFRIIAELFNYDVDYNDGVVTLRKGV